MSVPKPTECTGDAITHPFCKVREKDGGPAPSLSLLLC